MRRPLLLGRGVLHLRGAGASRRGLLLGLASGPVVIVTLLFACMATIFLPHPPLIPSHGHRLSPRSPSSSPGGRAASSPAAPSALRGRPSGVRAWRSCRLWRPRLPFCVPGYLASAGVHG